MTNRKARLLALGLPFLCVIVAIASLALIPAGILFAIAIIVKPSLADHMTQVTQRKMVHSMFRMAGSSNRRKAA